MITVDLLTSLHPQLLDAWIKENPLSDLLFELELRARLLEVHSRSALSKRDFDAYAPLNALMVNILDALRRFQQEVTERIENDEPRNSPPDQPMLEADRDGTDHDR